jgi:hypothetical protein
MNKLIGVLIERPPKPEVRQKPQIEEPVATGALQRLLDGRQELRDQVHDMEFSESDPEELAESQQDLAEVDALLFAGASDADKARIALSDELARLDRQYEGHQPDPAIKAERLMATAHAYGTHLDYLDPERDRDTIADGRAFLRIVNPSVE